jgi:GNAT superfamily N-acetyltransferase
MDALTVRPAGADERGLVAEIHEVTACLAYAHIFPGQPFPREETSERWRTFPGRMVVAEAGAEIIGFVAFDDSELQALYVLPAYQGQGIGSHLLEAAGAVSCLWVLKANDAARRFYATRGWIAEGSERAAYGVVEMLYIRAREQRP